MRAKSRPLISVVVPTYNRAQSVHRTVDSILAQQTDGLFEVEVIAVDNASTDDTWSILSGYGDRIQAIRERRPGESFARNAGISAARGQWVALIDDDEIAHPQWLATLYKTAQERRVHIVAGLAQLALSDSMRASLGPICRRVLSEVDCESPYQLLGPDIPSTNNVLVESSVFEKIGAFNEKMTIASDSEFFIRARDAGFEMWRTPHSIVLHVLPEHRLSREFLALRARWQGAYFVILESQGRSSKALFLGLTRLVSAPFIHLPQLLWCRRRGLKWQALGHELRLHRAWACARAAMTVIAPKVFSQEEYLAQLRKPPDFNITPQRPGLGQRLWHLLDVARRRLQIGFEPHERQHSVEGVDFRFLVASPEAEDWYEKGKGAQEHRPDLAFWKSSLVRPGDLVFDCGGFQGFTTVFLARCVGDQGRVVTFELNPQNAAIIEKNISLNQLCNAEVERVAVGNESGNVQFLKRPNAAIIPSKNSWLSTLQSMVFGREEAAQIALDDYCSRHELWPTVIKIDVEGYEVEVLAGARALLRSKPRLAIELHPDLLSRRGQNADDIFEYLDRDSFSFWIQWNEEDAPVPYDGSPITERVQFFALPR